MDRKQETQTLREWRETATFWKRHAHTIELMFAPITRALIKEAEIKKGDKVLDVAGGAGEPSLSIAEHVGPSGLVTCTDAVADMVAAAANEAQRRGITNVQFRQCTADALPFEDDQFDCVVCRLGVMFFPDPLQGLREMLRVCKPGGHLSLVVWAKSELNPFCYVITNTVARYIEPTAVPSASSDAFRFAEPAALGAILKEAGAIQIREHNLEFQIAAPISAAEFWSMRSETSGTLREKLSGLAEEEQTEIGRAVQEAVREFFPENQMRFPAQMIIVSGTKTRTHTTEDR